MLCLFVEFAVYYTVAYIGEQVELQVPSDTWLRRILFSRNSLAARTIAMSLVESLWQAPSRRRHVIDMLST